MIEDLSDQAPEAREDVHAVIHAHPIYCTSIAIKGLDIPSLHYMIAVTGRDVIRCARYATFACRTRRPTKPVRPRKRTVHPTREVVCPRGAEQS